MKVECAFILTKNVRFDIFESHFFNKVEYSFCTVHCKYTTVLLRSSQFTAFGFLMVYFIPPQLKHLLYIDAVGLGWFILSVLTGLIQTASYQRFLAFLCTPVSVDAKTKQQLSAITNQGLNCHLRNLSITRKLGV